MTVYLNLDGEFFLQLPAVLLLVKVQPQNQQLCIVPTWIFPAVLNAIYRSLFTIFTLCLLGDKHPIRFAANTGNQVDIFTQRRSDIAICHHILGRLPNC